MRRLFILFFVLSVLMPCTSCRKEAPIGPSTTVVVSFKAVYGDEPFYADGLYAYPSTGSSSEIIQFDDVSLFLTDISLVTANGEDEVSLDDIKYWGVTALQAHGSNAETALTKAYYSVPLGDYTGISFGVGVGHEANSQKPSDFAAGSPLGAAERYSSEFGSYVFDKTKGQYSTNGTTTPFEINILKDEHYKKVVLQKDFTITSSGGSLNVILDLKKVFQRNDSIMDLPAHPIVTNPGSPYMDWVSENLQHSFSF